MLQSSCRYITYNSRIPVAVAVAVAVAVNVLRACSNANGMQPLSHFLYRAWALPPPTPDQISSGKCFITDLIGFGAAWPRPQIEVSVMAVVSSVKRD